MGHKVMDFTGSRTTPAIVKVSLHAAADLLLGLWILQGGNDEEKSTPRDSFDIGETWFEDFGEHLSDETTARLEKFGPSVWIGLLSLLAEETDGGTVDTFIELLSTYDPVELRHRLLMLYDMVPDDARGLAADAAEGDAEALETVLALPEFTEHQAWATTLRRLLEMTPEETRSALAETLGAVQQDIFSKYEAEFRPGLERDLTAKRSLARRLSPERLVEIATNGISIEEGGYIQPIMLVPTIVGRPWVIFTESKDQLVLCYPVAEEYLDADPDAPPQWLVKIYKALGDERRLRILRRLSKAPASLAELVDEMGGSKSTIHHHLMLLRSAGLLRVTLGTEKEYSLRADVVPETAAVLHAYIGGPEHPEEGR